MKMKRDKEMERMILDKILKKRTDREIHVTDLVYCLRKAYFRLKDVKADIPDSKRLLFTAGRAHHEILEVLKDKEVPVKVYDIKGTIDMVKHREVCGAYVPIEIKTTRGKTIQPHWIIQLGFYCTMLNTYTGYLVVFYLINPRLEAYKCEFTDEELDNFLNIMLKRKEILQKALEENKPPSKSYIGFEGECRHCEFRKICKEVDKDGEV